MANSSTSVEMTFIAQWIVLMVGLLCMWIYEMDIATRFFMFVSNITIDEKLDEAVKVILSRFLIWFLTFFSHKWKENL